MSDIRITHTWYDGPQVVIEVDVDGTWTPYGDTGLADAIDRWADREGGADRFLDTRLWPEGRYRFTGGVMRPVDATVVDGDTPVTGSLQGTDTPDAGHVVFRTLQEAVDRIEAQQADIERLRAAILEWDASTDCFWDDADSYHAAVLRYRNARAAAVAEARRG